MKVPKIETNEEDRTNTFQRPVWFKTTPGQHRIRILPPEIYDTYTHFIRTKAYPRGLSIECPGERCPICEGNEIIRNEEPNTFRQNSAYSPKRRTFYANVLDRTLVKICSNSECEHQNKKNMLNQFPPVCEVCGSELIDKEPQESGKVKLLSKGVEVFKPITDWHENLLDDDGNRLSITDFDIILHTSADKRSTIPSHTLQTDEVKVPEDALYNLSSATIKLSPEELQDLLTGVSLRDIYSTKNTIEESAMEEETVTKELKDEILDEIANLLD